MHENTPLCDRLGNSQKIPCCLCTCEQGFHRRGMVSSRSFNHLHFPTLNTDPISHNTAQTPMDAFHEKSHPNAQHTSLKSPAVLKKLMIINTATIMAIVIPFFIPSPSLSLYTDMCVLSHSFPHHIYCTCADTVQDLTGAPYQVASCILLRIHRTCNRFHTC